MKKRFTYINTVFLSVLFMTLLSTRAAAQPEDFEDDVPDNPTVPIDDYLYIGLIAGAALGYKFLKRSPSTI